MWFVVLVAGVVLVVGSLVVVVDFGLIVLNSVVFCVSLDLYIYAGFFFVFW